MDTGCLDAACGVFLVKACGIEFPDQGSNLWPLHWECRVLATGPAQKPCYHCFLKTLIHHWARSFALFLSNSLLLPGTKGNPPNLGPMIFKGKLLEFRKDVLFNQAWLSITAPLSLPPDAKNWLIRKDPDAGKDWRQKEKGMTEDKMVGWHHWLNGHKFE